MAIEIVAKPDALAVVAEIGVGQSAVRRVAVALIGITAVNAVVKVADAALQQLTGGTGSSSDSISA